MKRTQTDESRILKGVRLFSLGQIVGTPGALKAMKSTACSPRKFLNRHVRGDWGELCEEDRQTNNEALADNLRILSTYRLRDGTKIWIITEADRSVTTILLPEEY